MQPNSGSTRGHQSESKDRPSTLPDDVLLLILGRVEDISTAVRTSTLSTRWRWLPWLLPELSIDADKFIPDPHLETIDDNVIHDAMLTFTTATKTLLAKHRRQYIVARLALELYMIDAFLSDIGLLLRDTIDCGLLKDLDLSILENTHPNYSPSYMLRRAKDLEGFFSAYPSVFHCLTTLYLDNVRFVQSEMHHVLFDCCKQLEHLTLYRCDAGDHSLWKIDAPNSKLRVLELSVCWFERVELISLPKLEKLDCAYWISYSAPLSFCSVPLLEELCLTNYMDLDQNIFKLSELLHGAAGIHTLALDFHGENIWVQPEIKQLVSKFSKLRKLFMRRVFVEFDLLWTITFLEAAPSVEILYIDVVEHACREGVRQNRYRIRRSPQWELGSCGSKNLLLKELQIVGFRPLEQQLKFIRAMLERAPNLRVVTLKRDKECKACDIIALAKPSCASVRPAFPKNKDEQDTVVRQVADGTFFSGRIIFGD